jgi:IstB-like ATP binding protein
VEGSETSQDEVSHESHLHRSFPHLSRRLRGFGSRVLDRGFAPQVRRSPQGVFIAPHEDALFLGPPGTGKSHLAQAIGQAAIQQGYRVLYRETAAMAARRRAAMLSLNGSSTIDFFGVLDAFLLSLPRCE